jgi:hypothetical protein
MQPQPAPRAPGIAVALFVIALAAHILIAFPMLALGLVAPLYAIVIFWAIWAIMLSVLIRVRRTRPLLTPLVPVATAVMVFGGVNLGGALLGWTA